MNIRDLISDYLRLSPLNLSGTAKALSNLRFSGGGGGGFGGWGGLFNPFNTRINYASELGAGQNYEGLRNLTLIQAAVQWVARGLISAPLKVVEITSTDDKEQQVDHPLVDLFRRPNAYYSRSVLLRGIALSLIVADEAYILKVRSRYGRQFGAPIELWWEPHWTIRPRWSIGGSNFIDYYEYERDGIWYPVDPADVIVLRRDLDPITRRGFGPTSSLLREFYTDQQASGFMAQLLRQGLVPPVIVGLGTKDNPYNGNDDDRRSFARALIRKMSGDKAGEPMVVPGGVDVQQLGFDYSKVGLERVRRIPVERFCAVMGISPVSLNLAATSDKAQAYANVKNYLEHDYDSYIVALHNYIGEEFETQLLPDFGDTANLAIRWNYDQAPEKQPDKLVEAGISTMLYKGGLITRNEGREINAYKPDAGGDEYATPATTQSFSNQDNMIDPTAKSLDFDTTDDDDLADGVDWWKRSAPKMVRRLSKPRQVS